MQHDSPGTLGGRGPERGQKLPGEVGRARKTKFAVSQPPAPPWVIGTGLHTLDQFVDQLLSDEVSSPGL